MRHFKKKTIALCLASMIATLGSFSAANYEHKLLSLKIDNNIPGIIKLTAVLNSDLTRELQVSRVSESEYSIILPDTISVIDKLPNVSDYSNITGINIATFPYTQNKEGYTSITLKTVNSPVLFPTTSLAIKQDDLKLLSSKKENDIKPVPPPQKSYWDSHTRKTDDNNVEKEELQEKQKKSEKASPNEDAAQSPTLAADMDGNAGEFEINDEQTQEYHSSETYPYIIGVVLLLVLIIFIYFVGKERMSGVVGEQKNFNIDSDDNDKDSKKSKIKKITKTINKLDKTYSHKHEKPSKSNFEMPMFQAEVKENVPSGEAEVNNIVDLDALFQEQLKKKVETEQDETESVDNGFDDLADLFKDFSESPEESEHDVADDAKKPVAEEKFDESLYENIISSSNITFTKQDGVNLSQLIQNEVRDDTVGYINDVLKQQAPTNNVMTKEQLLENILGEYIIKQQIDFTKEDVDIIRELLSVELDPSFISDLRTNSERTKEMQEELIQQRNEIHIRPSVIQTLKVRDLLPDLSLELKKQGNNPIKSEHKPDVVYFSEGYEVNKLAVSEELIDIESLGKYSDNSFRPSDEISVVEKGYDVPTLSTGGVLPVLSDVLANPEKYEVKDKHNTVDEQALLNSISNVVFKPFYEEEEDSYVLDFDSVSSIMKGNIDVIQENIPKEQVADDNITKKYELEPEIKLAEKDVSEEKPEDINNKVDIIKQDTIKIQQPISSTDVENNCKIVKQPEIQKSEKSVQKLHDSNKSEPKGIENKTVHTYRNPSRVEEPISSAVDRNDTSLKSHLVDNDRKRTLPSTDRLSSKTLQEAKTTVENCKIDGVVYTIRKKVKCDNNLTCYLAVNSNEYFVIAEVHSVYHVIKNYESLNKELINIRLHQKDTDGYIQYLVRAGNNKFILKLDGEKVEFVMDLC